MAQFTADNEGQVNIVVPLDGGDVRIRIGGMDGRMFAPDELVTIHDARLQGMLDKLLVPFRVPPVEIVTSEH